MNINGTKIAKIFDIDKVTSLIVNFEELHCPKCKSTSFYVRYNPYRFSCLCCGKVLTEEELRGSRKDKCPKCGSEKTHETQEIWTPGEEIKAFKCDDCYHTWWDPPFTGPVLEGYMVMPSREEGIFGSYAMDWYKKHNRSNCKYGETCVHCCPYCCSVFNEQGNAIIGIEFEPKERNKK